MWILTETGFIHSGRIIEIHPPREGEGKETVNVSFFAGSVKEVRILRADAERLLGMSREQIKEKALTTKAIFEAERHLKNG